MEYTRIESAISVKENTTITLPDDCIGYYIQNLQAADLGNAVGQYLPNFVKINDGIVLSNGLAATSYVAPEKIIFNKKLPNNSRVKVKQLDPAVTQWEVVIVPILEY